MTEPNFTAFKWVFKLIGSAPKLYERVNEWRGQPSKEDRERLVRYCRRLDERRVFSAPFNVEVEEICISSLRQVKDYTDEALAELEHPTARAAVGAILDETRKFLDTWHDYRGPRRWVPEHRWGAHEHEGDRQRDFFQDLGELRGKMKVLVGMLTELAPNATAPKLLGK
jgi:hypothetical protein